MPTDLAHSPPPTGVPPPSTETLLQEEALLRALLHRVEMSSDKAHLQDRSEAAVQLILNRESDQPLRDRLIADISRLIALLPEDVSAGPGRSALAKAAEGCLAILRAAEQERVAPSPPAPPVTPVAVASSAASYEHLAQTAASHPHAHPHPHPHAHPPAPEQSSRHVVGMVVLSLVILAGGLAIGLRGRGGDQAVRPLVAQMEAAAHGNVPGTNIFGGMLNAAVQGGRTVVTVERIPPGECVSSGWDLVHKGLLTVNGVTPNRVSAAKLNELCHAEDTATLSWSPKAP